MKNKSTKNKTIDFTEEEGEQYIRRCVKNFPLEKIKVDQIINKTILGDTFELLKRMPSSFVDLLIVDPPYNLSKDYHGNKFSKTSSKDYRKYTIEWLTECKRIMKENATIYVCCDWQTSLIIRRYHV